MDSTNFQHHQQQQQHLQQQHLHQQHLLCLNNNPNHPSSTSGFDVSTSLPWNTNQAPSLLSASQTSSNKLYDNDFSNAASGECMSNNTTLSNTTISLITNNDAKNLNYPNTTNLPKIEEDMLSSFPSFSGLLQMDQNNPCAWPFSALNSGAHYNNSSYNNNNNNMNNWIGNFNSTSFLNQLGYVSSPNSTTSVTSSPRLGLNLQAMDFLGNNNNNNNNTNASNFSSHHNRGMYEVGDEVVSPAAGRIMPSNKLSEDDERTQTMTPTILLNHGQASGENDSVDTPSLGLMHPRPLTERDVNPTSVMNNNGVTGTKRAAGGSYSSSDQSNKPSSSTHSTPSKKSHLKVSCPPFKVRKEKLAERIAGLHQLVSPFGKTDTASVLTEAIGYIQFLQDQIHTLCMPHAKPSRSKPSCRPFQMGGHGSDEDRIKEEARIDLQRRGLCLVPLSWTSYVGPSQLDASNPTSYF